MDQPGATGVIHGIDQLKQNVAAQIQKQEEICKEQLASTNQIESAIAERKAKHYRIAVFIWVLQSTTCSNEALGLIWALFALGGTFFGVAAALIFGPLLGVVVGTVGLAVSSVLVASAVLMKFNGVDVWIRDAEANRLEPDRQLGFITSHLE